MSDSEGLEIALPWRCDVTGNPVGSDTEMVGAPPCMCQGHRAAAHLRRLASEGETLREKLHYANGAQEAAAKGLREAEADNSRLRGKVEEMVKVIAGGCELLDGDPEAGDPGTDTFTWLHGAKDLLASLNPEKPDTTTITVPNRAARNVETTDV